MEQLVRINWTGVIGRSSCLALVLVKRQHTARCLSEYLSNQGELISRGVRTTFINAGRSADKGEGLFSYFFDLRGQTSGMCKQINFGANFTRKNSKGNIRNICYRLFDYEYPVEFRALSKKILTFLKHRELPSLCHFYFKMRG